ncbi:hypothetical protein GC169_06955 [bacterium]|nr:hypothetical protein [bacterium]
MTNDRSIGDGPEPIEAEFEPAPGAEDRAGERAPPNGTAKGPRLRRGVSHGELALATGVAAISGAVMAIVVNGSGAGGPAGLGVEVARLTAEQEATAKRADDASGQIASLAARVEDETRRLAGQLQQQRNETAALQNILDELSDASAGGVVNGGLVDRVTALEDAAAAAATGPQSPAQLQSAMRDLAARVAKLESSVTAASQDLQQLRTDVAGATELRTEVGAVRQTLTTLESERAPVEGALAGMKAIRALNAVESAAGKGRPFPQQHSLLADALPADADVAALQPIARKGAPTFEQIRREFEAAAKRAEQAAISGTDDGWNWLRTAVSGVMTIERTQSGGAESRAINRARTALEGGDVPASLTEIAAIDGDAAAAFQPWRERTQRRVELDTRLEAIGARLAAGQAAQD